MFLSPITWHLSPNHPLSISFTIPPYLLSFGHMLFKQSPISSIVCPNPHFTCNLLLKLSLIIHQIIPNFVYLGLYVFLGLDLIHPINFNPSPTHMSSQVTKPLKMPTFAIIKPRIQSIPLVMSPLKISFLFLLILHQPQLNQQRFKT